MDELGLTTNRDITSFEIEGGLHSFREDPLDNTVAGDPLVEIPVGDTLVPDVTGADGTVTFENGVVSVRVDEDAEGDLIAISERAEFLGSPSCCNGGNNYQLAFYLLPEGTAFPPDVAQLSEAAPINSFFGEQLDRDIADGGSISVLFEDALETIGAVQIGVADLGANGRNGSDGDDPGTVFDTVVREFDVDSNRAFASFRTHLEASETISLSRQTSNPTSAFQVIIPTETLLPEITGPTLA